MHRELSRPAQPDVPDPRCRYVYACLNEDLHKMMSFRVKAKSRGLTPLAVLPPSSRGEGGDGRGEGSKYAPQVLQEVFEHPWAAHFALPPPCLDGPDTTPYSVHYYTTLVGT